MSILDTTGIANTNCKGVGVRGKLGVGVCKNVPGGIPKTALTRSFESSTGNIFDRPNRRIRERVRL